MKINFKRIKKKLISLNFTTVFFFLLSSISLTLAWFAYNNVVHSQLEIGVSAWHIELNDGTDEISHEVLIPIKEFYPGVKKYTKTIEILNKGDIDAEFSYSISYLRILNKEFDTSNQEELFDTLAQEYPFLFNVVADSNYIASQESIMLNIVVDWPLDSGNDLLDSKWGNDAYNFTQQENLKKSNDKEYEIKSVIEIILELNTKQYIEENQDVTDNRYLYGNVYNYNINTLEPCNIGESNCYNFYVIDKNNLLSDTTVNMIIDTKNYIAEGNYMYISSLVTEKLQLPSAEIILNAIARDINDTTIIISNNSERIVGEVGYNNRATNLLNHIAISNGYIKFNSEYFNNLSSEKCYWTNTTYNNDMIYAINVQEKNYLKLYGENKEQNCTFVPIITIEK